MREQLRGEPGRPSDATTRGDQRCADDAARQPDDAACQRIDAACQRIDAVEAEEADPQSLRRDDADALGDDVDNAVFPERFAVR
jgi:hypothetical protein